MNILILGSAGAGKTLLTGRFGSYLKEEGYKVRLVNLDPGVVTLPYKPDFDVRERFTLEQIMKEKGLGPNGAIVEAMEMLSRTEIPRYDADFVLIDTPGQLEVFAFRNSGPKIASQLKERFGLFLIDATSPIGTLPGLLLYSLTISYTLGLDKLVNVLNKIDLLDERRKEVIHTTILERIPMHKDREGILTELGDEIGQLLNRFTSTHRTPMVSAISREGFDELLSVIYEVQCVCGDID
jgi:hypothetical protein